MEGGRGGEGGGRCAGAGEGRGGEGVGEGEWRAAGGGQEYWLLLGVARLLLGVATPLLSSCLLASILLCLARFVLARWRAVFRGLGEGALLLGRGLVGEG